MTADATTGRQDEAFVLALRRLFRPVEWRRAFDRWAAQQPPGAVAVVRQAGNDALGEESPSEVAQTSRVWMEGPLRWRHEIDLPDGSVSVKVVDGRVWWSYVPGVHALSNESDPDAFPPSADDHPAWEVFHAREMMGKLSVTDSRPDEYLGRAVDVLHALPRTDPHPRLPPGADSFTFTIDRTSGLVLRVDARLEGQEFWSLKVTALEVDGPLSPELFRIVLPAGARFDAPPVSPVQPWRRTW